jgi:hypothetical protein
MQTAIDEEKVLEKKRKYNRHAQHCNVWHVYFLCVKHIHDPMLLP